MEPTTIVHGIKAVLGTQTIIVYGEDVLRHIIADGEAERLSVVEVPIRHPEAAEALKGHFAGRVSVSVADVQRAYRAILEVDRHRATDTRAEDDDDPPSTLEDWWRRQ